MPTIKALIKPKLLVWTRNRAKVTLEDAAQAANVAVEDVQAWEKGEEAPTLNQLRKLAAKYHFPLAVFYLPEPPQDFAPLRDFRRSAKGGGPKHIAESRLSHSQRLRTARTGD